MLTESGKNVRIVELPETEEIKPGYSVPVDDNVDGTKKFDLSKLTTAIEGKASQDDLVETVSSLNDEIALKADRATTLSGYGITDAKIENTASNTVVTLGSNTLTVGMSDGRVNTIDSHTLFAERSTNDATGREIAPNLVPDGRADGTMLSVVEDGGVVSMSWDTGHPVTVTLHLPDTYYNPLGLPPFTIRLQMVDSSVTPTGRGTWSRVSDTEDTWDCTYDNTSWDGLFYYNTGIKAVLGANTEGVLSMSGTFCNCKNMESVALFDTSTVTNAQGMFLGCETLSSVPFFDTGSVTDMGSMFNGCTALQAIPHFDTRNVTNMGGTFYGCKSLVKVPLLDTRNVTIMNITFGECSSLVTIPLFDTSKVTNVTEVFVDCVNVETGMLALYEQLSGQSNPPNVYHDAFTNCGTATEQGRTELAQIPSSWGGTAT